MPGMGERAYAYAKACGIIGKSFVGRRISGLGSVSRVPDLYELVFPGANRNLPERELLIDLEDRIVDRTVKQILAVVNSFAKPPDLLVRLIRTYEYAELKVALNALFAGESKGPKFTDIGRFRTVKFESYPDISAMLGGTEFAFLDKKVQEAARRHEDPGIALQVELDRLYYTRLWASLLALPRGDRIAIKRIVGEEISLRNDVWALRLRTYYGMDAAEIREKFIRVGTKQEFALDAEASLSMSLDNRVEWKGWNRERFLNPEKSDQHWQADPRHFQNAASEYLYELARLSFRRRPFSLDTVFCFIKLKQFEEDLLTSVAEGLGMGLSSQEVFGLLEVEW